jgi:hypothetical protein
MVLPDAVDPRFVTELDHPLPLPHPHGALDVDECRHHEPGMMRKPESGTIKDVSKQGEQSSWYSMTERRHPWDM